MKPRLPLRWILAAVACAVQPLVAQTLATGAAAGAATAKVAEADRGVEEWLQRLQQASRGRSFTGTFIVSSAPGDLSSSRIWHVCDGTRQMERVESLTGVPRTTFRRDDEVMIFLPESRLVRVERSGASGPFPNLAEGDRGRIADLYGVRLLGHGRVAGYDADIVELMPKDGLRFGYRIWSERRTGLIVKSQTLDEAGRVLEQAAFSELRLDVPVPMERLAQMMNSTQGYRIERDEPVPTTPAAEGWALARPVAGFRSVSCYRRPGAAPVVQWIFSDGIASVSLFIRPIDRQRPSTEGVMAMGATMTLTRRLGGASGDWWLTAVGEVPARTLAAFADSLQRRP